MLDEFRLDSKTMRHDGSGKVIVSFVFDLSSVACMEDTYCLIKLILQVVWWKSYLISWLRARSWSCWANGIVPLVYMCSFYQTQLTLYLLWRSCSHLFWWISKLMTGGLWNPPHLFNVMVRAEAWGFVLWYDASLNMILMNRLFLQTDFHFWKTSNHHVSCQACLM